jgi:hypothetical protein
MHKANKEYRCVQKGSFSLAAHIPRGLEGCVEVALCADHVAWQTADAVSTGTDGVLLDVGDAAAVAANTAGITCGAFVAEARWRCEVQSGESRRLAESVSGRLISERGIMQMKQR